MIDRPTKIKKLSVSLDPVGKHRHTGVNAGVTRQSAALSPGSDSNNHSVVEEWATSITVALIATTDIQPASAQHVVGNGATQFGIAGPASVLVHGPDLNVTKLFRWRTEDLKNQKIFMKTVHS